MNSAIFYIKLKFGKISKKIKCSLVIEEKILYYNTILAKGNLCVKEVSYLNGYMLIWILLQKIEKLEEELLKYRKDNVN